MGIHQLTQTFCIGSRTRDYLSQWRNAEIFSNGLVHLRIPIQASCCWFSWHCYFPIFLSNVALSYSLLNERLKKPPFCFKLLLRCRWIFWLLDPICIYKCLSQLLS